MINRSTLGVSRSVGRDPQFAISDVLLPISIAVWIVGVRLIRPSPVPLSILPAGSVVVFVAVSAYWSCRRVSFLRGASSRHRMASSRRSYHDAVRHCANRFPGAAIRAG